MVKAVLNKDEILNLAQKTAVAIYGAGVLGMELFEFLRKNRPDIEVKFFIDKTAQNALRINEAKKRLDGAIVLIASIPPNSNEMIRELGDYRFIQAFSTKALERTLRACHRENLFIRENGDVYPCCSVWGIDKYKIGNINDSDLFKKIDEFDADCVCNHFRLIKGTGEEVYKTLNIELSYVCQAKCAMCCTNSPDLSVDYKFNNYEKIEALIAKLKPKTVVVQGGEILVQPESLDFIEKIKKTIGTEFHIVTNGNCISQIERAKALFSAFSVSFVGFQPQTYKSLMGLDIEKTKKFCEEILKIDKEVYLKYLLSPINIHELPLFLEWALGFKNLAGIFIHDSNCLKYIQKTEDNYWDKIAKRTGTEVARLLKDTTVPFLDIDTPSSNLLGLNSQ